MSKKTVIKCPCGGTLGEYLGEIKDSSGENHIHKCLSCRRQLKTKKEDGLHFA